MNEEEADSETGDNPAIDAIVTTVPPGTVLEAQVEAVHHLTEEAAQQLRSERSPTTTPYDPSRERERVRSNLSYAIFGLTGLTGITTVVGALAGADGVDSVLNGVFTPLIGLSGAVIGFYFGGRDTSSRSG